MTQTSDPAVVTEGCGGPSCLQKAKGLAIALYIPPARLAGGIEKGEEDMPRIKLGESMCSTYSRQDFLRHVSAQQHFYGYPTQRDLAEAVGCSQGTICNYSKKPDTMSVTVLRNMVKTLRLDPVYVLKFLGYTSKDIRKIRLEDVHDEK